MKFMILLPVFCMATCPQMGENAGSPEVQGGFEDALEHGLSGNWLGAAVSLVSVAAAILLRKPIKNGVVGAVQLVGAAISKGSGRDGTDAKS